MRRSTLESMAAGLVILLAARAVAEPSRAGAAETVRGAVTARSGDEIRSLEKGSDFFVGDLVATGPRGLAILAYADATRFMLGQNSELGIVEYRDRESGAGVLTAKVAKGSFRFVSGLIAKTRPEAMKVEVSRLATIGVRGTDVGGEIKDGGAVIVLLESESPGSATAIRVSNEFGAVEIDKPGWGTHIADENSPPSPPRRMRLRAVENLVRNLGRMQRMPRYR